MKKDIIFIIIADELYSGRCFKCRDWDIASFEKNPEKGGIPHIDSVPISVAKKIKGCFLNRFFGISKMFWLWWVFMIIQPAQRNKRALKNPWVTRWKKAIE